MRQMIAWTACTVCVLGLALGVSAVSARQRIASAESSGLEHEPGQGCTNASLRGTYGFFRTGTTAQGPLGAVGLATYDGFGFFTASQTISRNGVFTQSAFDGTYEIDSDCSGRLLSTDGQSVTGYLSVVDNGDEIFMLSASAGNSVTGISKRVRDRDGR